MKSRRGFPDRAATVDRIGTTIFPMCMGTNVRGGDMRPLLDHPALEHVAFTKKKRFSPSERDIRKAKGW